MNLIPMGGSFKKYVTHYFFYEFTESLFFVFGAMLLYTKSGSVFAVLVFGLIIKMTALFLRTIGLQIYFKLVEKIGMLNVLGLGSLLMAIAFIGIFYCDAASPYFYFFFFGLAIVRSTGNVLFINVSSAIKRQILGMSDTPGKFSAIISITGFIAQILAVGGAFLLNFSGHFLFSFVLGGIFQLASLIPLRGMKLPAIQRVSFWKCMKKISLPAFFANINIEHELKVTALPLIIMLHFSSTDTSISVSTLVALGGILIAYLAGSYKDGKKKRPTVSAFIISMVGWISYGILTESFMFVVIGITLELVSEVIEIGREARLSREVSNSKTPLETTIGIEIPRTLGMLISFVILLIVYKLTGTLPQTILIWGALFIIPKALYAIGNTAEKKV